MVSLKDRLIEILISNKLITQAQLEQSLLVQKENGGKLSDIIVALRFIKESELVSIVEEVFSSIRVVKAFAREDYEERRFERQSDRYALDRTGLKDAYLSAFRKLAKLNKDDPTPHWLDVLLFHSHPPVAERIEAARRFTS